MPNLIQYLERINANDTTLHSIDLKDQNIGDAGAAQLSEALRRQPRVAERIYSLDLRNNKLATMDVSGLRVLTLLNLRHNQLTGIDVSGLRALRMLDLGDNQLTSVKLLDLRALTILDLSDNQLTSIDVSRLRGLTDLYLSNNQLTSIDVARLSALTSLSLYGNKLTSIDVSRLTALTNLNISNNQLTSIDVSRLSALTSLSLYANKLTSIDVSSLSALTNLELSNNLLTSIHVSSLRAFAALEIDNNRLTTLTKITLHFLQARLPNSRSTGILLLDELPFINAKITSGHLRLIKNSALNEKIPAALQDAFIAFSKNKIPAYIAQKILQFLPDTPSGKFTNEISMLKKTIVPTEAIAHSQAQASFLNHYLNAFLPRFKSALLEREQKAIESSFSKINQIKENKKDRALLFAEHRLSAQTWNNTLYERHRRDLQMVVYEPKLTNASQSLRLSIS